MLPHTYEVNWAGDEHTEVVQLWSFHQLKNVNKQATLRILVRVIRSRRPVSQAGAGGAHSSQFLPDQSTLSQPGVGGHIIPTQFYIPPGFSDLATALGGDVKK